MLIWIKTIESWNSLHSICIDTRINLVARETTHVRLEWEHDSAFIAISVKQCSFSPGLSKAKPYQNSVRVGITEIAIWSGMDETRRKAKLGRTHDTNTAPWQPTAKTKRARRSTTHKNGMEANHDERLMMSCFGLVALSFNVRDQSFVWNEWTEQASGMTLVISAILQDLHELYHNLPLDW